MEEGPSRWRFNHLCIFGAIVGLVALFLPWDWMVMVGISSAGKASTAFYWMNSSPVGLLNGFDVLDFFKMDMRFYGTGGFDSNLYLLGLLLILYISGTIIAFISPIGGFIQIAGALISIPIIPSEWWFNWFIPFGELLGIYSGIIVVTSMFRPIGPGYADRPIGIRKRLLTFGRSPIQSPATLETDRKERSHEIVAGSILSLLRRIYASKRMVLILLIPIFLILAALSYYVTALSGPHQPSGGTIGTNKGIGAIATTWTVTSISGGSGILKSDVYVQIRNATGLVMTTTSLSDATGHDGFTYSPATTGKYISVGDVFSLSRDYAAGCTLKLVTPDGQFSFVILTV